MFSVCQFTGGRGLKRGPFPEGGGPSPVTDPVQSPIPGPARGMGVPPSPVAGPVPGPVPESCRGGGVLPAWYPQPQQDRAAPPPLGQDRG